ncbi:MAG: type II restriction endonuclease subunit M, partial [Ignavibacteriales bacterium]|nr:type II restriction endonuclease subunit M [Ignavibacteriales bacterium]
MATADNEKFLRYWQEVSISCSMLSEKMESKANYKWFRYAKGGDFRRWYGNLDWVVNWANGGEEIKNFTDSNGKVRSHNYNDDYIFNDGITWNALSSGPPSMRLLVNSLFDNA